MLYLSINYLVYLLLKVVFGGGVLAGIALGLAYYFLIRKVVVYIVFVGCFPIYRRKLEVNMQE